MQVIPVAAAENQERAGRRLFGLQISGQTQEQLIRDLLAPSQAGAGPQLVATLNLDHVVNLRKSARFRDAYAWAWRVTIDGAPVFAYARSRRISVAERITGADLFAAMANAWEPEHHRLFFCVSSLEVVHRVMSALVERGFRNADLHFAVPPFGFHKDEALSRELVDAIQHFVPTHLILGLGSPKSELWVFEHRGSLGDCKVLAVGAAVEFFAGMKSRAPGLMREAGFEWVWRLGSEPRRLFRRYCIDSLGFFAAARADLKSRGQSVV